MPTEMSSWADEIDETDTSLILPPPSEKWVGNQKITTEYSHNDDGKKVRLMMLTPPAPIFCAKKLESFGSSN